MEKDIMQEKVLHEVSCLLEEVKENFKCNNNIISMQNLIDEAVGSVINSVLLGYRFNKNNILDFYDTKRCLAEMLQSVDNLFWKVMEAGPKFFRYLPFFSSVFKNVEKRSNAMREVLEKQITKHKEEVKLKLDDNEPRDFVEAFLLQQKKLSIDGVVDHYFTDNQLYGAVWDLWVAGQETTSTVLAWLVLYVTYFPEIQGKIHNELDSVIASDRTITMNDKTNLPYINAVITETLRYSNIDTVNLLHRTLEDIEINGYKLPKNTTIVNNHATIHMDERYFENPKNFDPQRFIDANGKFVSKPEVIPFGVGKRVCPGESLSRMELFLFAANIFNQLKMVQVPEKLLSLKRIVAGIVIPEPYVVKVLSRW